MNTHTPFEFSKYGNLIKSFLHTKVGAVVGYYLNITGFNRVGVIHTDSKTGKEKFLGFAYNSRVAKGGDLIASLITGAAQNSITSPLPPKYIALSTTVLTPLVSDTTLSGETSATGLNRTLGTQAGYVTPSTLDGSCSYTVTNAFTNSSGSAITINSAALFDAVSGGNLFVEANLSVPPTLQPLDILTVVWSVNL